MAKSSNLQNSIKIIITGLPSLDMGTNALEQGADAYLIKPVRPEELMALLSWKLKTNQLKSANQTVFGWQSRKKL